MRVWQFAVLIAWLGFASAGLAQNVSYCGGPILTNVRIVPVFWGATQHSTEIANFYSALNYSNSRINWLDYDYHVGGASISGA